MVKILPAVLLSVLPFVASSQVFSNGAVASTITKDLGSPVRFTVLKIDMAKKDVDFFGQRRASNFGAPLPETNTIYNVKEEKIEPASVVTVRTTVKEFLGKKKSSIAFGVRPTRRPYSGDFACPFGLFMSKGNVVSSHHARSYPAFVVRKTGKMEVADKIMPVEYETINFAVPGDAIIRKDGVSRAKTKTTKRPSCLAMGFTADQKTLYVISADNGSKYSGRGIISLKDVDEVLEQLEVSDAILFDNSSAHHAAIFGVDAEGKLQQINKLGDKESSYGFAYCMGISIKDKPLFPTKATSSEKAQERSVTAQIKQAKLSLSREAIRRGVERTVLRGQVRVNIKTSKERFKRPIMTVYALVEKDGAWRYYDGLVKEQRTFASSAMGVETTPAAISRAQLEVSADQWVQILYGDTKGGFFKNYSIAPETMKLLAYRVEFWQGGSLLDFVDTTTPKMVKKMGIPADWYIRGKYPNKISYCVPPPPPEKKK